MDVLISPQFSLKDRKEDEKNCFGFEEIMQLIWII